MQVPHDAGSSTDRYRNHRHRCANLKELTATAYLRLAMQDDDLAGSHLPQYPADAGPVCPALKIDQAGLSAHWHHDGPGNDFGGDLPGVLLRLQDFIASTACSIQSFAARPAASGGGLDAKVNAWSAAPSTVELWHGSLRTRMKEALTAATSGCEASLAAHVQAGALPAASWGQAKINCSWLEPSAAATAGCQERQEVRIADG